MQEAKADIHNPLSLPAHKRGRLTPRLQFPLRSFRLKFHQPCVEAILLHQLRMGTFFLYHTVIKDDDLVGVFDGTHAMSDHEDGLSFYQPGNGFLDFGLIIHIQRSGSLVNKIG